ncbi:hypothetical protein EZ449_12970 [Pedobacter frigidisoli]|uniref:Lipoprotein n=1 Tax=Pedobacter frigidisoli TaxID=2530455 RepID=A0A4R0P2S2_9SPHI|nr:hypothetical protein [Pedobacter frigidisoli]TCD08308.1 hypothetical protein EZ449_12970 [Pedobacter frigidisoli]
MFKQFPKYLLVVAIAFIACKTKNTKVVNSTKPFPKVVSCCESNMPSRFGVKKLKPFGEGNLAKKKL